MGLRVNPTQRQLRFGYELRKLRETAGLRAEEAGAHASLGGPHLRHIEGGRTAIPEEKLTALLDLYRCNRKPYVDGLLAMHASTGRGWWHAYRKDVNDQARDLAELEHMSRRLSCFEPLHLPGLLQTPEYMRSLIETSYPDNPPSYTDRGLDFRLNRQERLHQIDPPRYHAIIHEAAFQVRFIDSEVLRQQILHLIEISQLPHVTIQIVPFRSTGLPAVGTPCVLFEGPDPELSTVYLEHDVGCLFLHEQEHLTRYARTFERLSSAALPPISSPADHRSHLDRDSLSLLQHLLYTL